ncbi:uncharacterized protein LOC126737920 [Anthonomus grandis grandis]|uniref:uncharacterized protein LOC126737920 n=1 Tax=Anthonomus grandis grandis TaxID=2921223 RepID=UPI0021668DCE|nr:uncharacterized protein LOC126737920 [Anthonomus grandis grandis]
MKMGFQVVSGLLHCFIVYSLAFEDFIYVYGQGNKEMTEQGRVQYQMIRERGRLPKYGPCWKSALDHLDEGCRTLSEDTQSDIALHITNCFLEMSGHETYNCQLDKKPNLRGICINSMSDRAFNVYTEFYTHTQNICWFLRGQIWHETIAENTLKVGKQLELSAEQQEALIRVQQRSIEMQERMVEQGMFLEKVLEDVYVSTKAHQEILKVLSQTVSSLQTWLVGEISWIDTILFNTIALILIVLLTSSQRTVSARLPLFMLLFLNLITERIICNLYTKYAIQIHTSNLYLNLYNFVWYCRYAFTFLGAVIYLYLVLTYQDIMQQNLCILDSIKKQNQDILRSVEKFCKGNTPPELITSTTVDYENEQNRYFSDLESSYNYSKKKFLKENSSESEVPKKKLFESQSRRYHLRNHSRQGTPDSGVMH